MTVLERELQTFLDTGNASDLFVTLLEWQGQRYEDDMSGPCGDVDRDYSQAMMWLVRTYMGGEPSGPMMRRLKSLVSRDTWENDIRPILDGSIRIYGANSLKYLALLSMKGEPFMEPPPVSDTPASTGVYVPRNHEPCILMFDEVIMMIKPDAILPDNTDAYKRPMTIDHTGVHGAFVHDGVIHFLNSVSEEVMYATEYRFGMKCCLAHPVECEDDIKIIRESGMDVDGYLFCDGSLHRLEPGIPLG